MSLISFSKVWAPGDKLYAADLEAMKAAITAVVNGDLDDANIAAAADIALSKLGDYSANAGESRLSTNPLASTVWTETSASLATDIRGEFARLRYAIQKLTGGTAYDTRVNHGVLVAVTGVVWPYSATSPPTGWILYDDGTIGNGSSGASNRANADTVDLFTLWWNTYPDADCPVSTGRGASAAADYAANKTIRMPLLVGRLLGISGTPASANTTDTINLVSTSGGSATDIMIDEDFQYLADDLINGYTLTVTSGVRNGETSTVVDYTASTSADGTITVSPALTGALAAGDTFTLKKVVPTRANAARLGITDLIALGTPDVDATGSAVAIRGFGHSAETVASYSVTNYPPSGFMPHIIKL